MFQRGVTPLDRGKGLFINSQTRPLHANEGPLGPLGKSSGTAGYGEFSGTEAGLSGEKKAFFLAKVNYSPRRMSTFGSLPHPHSNHYLQSVDQGWELNNSCSTSSTIPLS